MMKKVICWLALMAPALPLVTSAQSVPTAYNIAWHSQSNSAAESMPCGGGDVGLNVWVENGELLIYVSKSGQFDEHNQLLKSGRIRVKCTPNPFEGNEFKQELKLQEGYVEIQANNNGLQATIKVWVDVFRPVPRVSLGHFRHWQTRPGYGLQYLSA